MADHTHPLDIHDLFCHYNALYFHDALGACVVSWSSQITPSYGGDCDYFPGGGCEILLSELVLKPRPPADIKNTLLHEMIHAFLWITKNNNDHSDHGASFQALVKAINRNVVRDPQRPIGGYNISLSHELGRSGSDCEVNLGTRCESCGEVVPVSTVKNNVSANKSEGNSGYASNSSSHHLHEGNKLCSDCFVKRQEAGLSRSSLKGDKLMGEGQQQLAEVRRKIICRKYGTEQLNHKDNMAGKSLESSLGVKGGSKSDASSSVDPIEVNICSKEVNLDRLQNLEIDSVHIMAAQEVPKQESTRKNMKLFGTCIKKRKLGINSEEPTVIIAWLNLFADEESDEDSGPLLNKRSERRKRQKLLGVMDGITSSNAIDETFVSPPCSGTGEKELSCENMSGNKLGKVHACSTSRRNEADIESQKIITEACAKVGQFDVPDVQAGDISACDKDVQYGSFKISPLHSPVTDDIVNISDG